MNQRVEKTKDIIYFKPAKNSYHIKGMWGKPKNIGECKTSRSRLWVDNLEILPESGFSLRPFYECGFDWGNTAGGSAYITSISICLAIFKRERIVENVFTCFKDEFVKRFPSGDFEVDIDLTSFLAQYQDRLQPDLYSRFCFSSLLNAREIYMHKDPYTGEVTANLSENYRLHNQAIMQGELRVLSERRERLMLRFFNKDEYLVKGPDFIYVLAKVETIMARFYWKSLERILKKQFFEK